VRGIRLKRKERGAGGEVTCQVLTGLEKEAKLMLNTEAENKQGG
jgi:hypothetical protein